MFKHFLTKQLSAYGGIGAAGEVVVSVAEEEQERRRGATRGRRSTEVGVAADRAPKDPLATPIAAPSAAGTELLC